MPPTLFKSIALVQRILAHKFTKNSIVIRTTVAPFNGQLGKTYFWLQSSFATIYTLRRQT